MARSAYSMVKESILPTISYAAAMQLQHDDHTIARCSASCRAYRRGRGSAYFTHSSIARAQAQA